MKSLTMYLAMLALACFVVAGCKPGDSGANGNGQTQPNEVREHDHGDDDHDHDHADDHDADGHSHEGDDHDHDHDHDHDSGKLGEVGPNNGHLIDFGSDPFKAEWVHYNDNDIIRIYVLDQEGKANRAVKADRVVVTRKAGAETVEFELEAEAPNADGESASYMREDKELAIAMTLGVEVIIEVDGQTHNGKIPAHEPHHH